jgi:hypothetical protein
MFWQLFVHRGTVAHPHATIPLTSFFHIRIPTMYVFFSDTGALDFPIEKP